MDRWSPAPAHGIAMASLLSSRFTVKELRVRNRSVSQPDSNADDKTQTYIWQWKPQHNHTVLFCTKIHAIVWYVGCPFRIFFFFGKAASNTAWYVDKKTHTYKPYHNLKYYRGSNSSIFVMWCFVRRNVLMPTSDAPVSSDRKWWKVQGW